MLKLQHRLKNNYAFLATYKQRQISGNKFFTLYLGRPKTNHTATFETKVGFVVSNKIHKRAVKRNRLKRLMRESMRVSIKNNTLFELGQFQSIVIVAKIDALTLNFKEVDHQIKFLLDGLRKNFAKHVK